MRFCSMAGVKAGTQHITGILKVELRSAGGHVAAGWNTIKKSDEYAG
jgi:hypothetical protein